MTCEVTAEQRIEFVYGELPPAQAAAIEAHLAECESCRRECEEFTQQMELMDRAVSVPVAAASTDLSKILATARSRANSRSRRWRRVALGAAAAALVIAVAAAAVRRVEVHATHVVIRWGGSAAPQQGQFPAAVDADSDRLRTELARTQSLLLEHRRRLDDLDRLAALVVSELKDDDAGMARLAFRIDALQRQNDERWQTVRRGFHGWYLAHVESAGDLQTDFTHQGDLP
jgi:hypothetical protein